MQNERVTGARKGLLLSFLILGMITGFPSVAISQFNGKRLINVNDLKANAVAVGDLNKDGIEDLVVAGDSHEASILFGRGNGTFEATSRLAVTGLNILAVQISDVDDDDNLDLIFAHYNQVKGQYYARVSVFKGNGDGTFQPENLLFLNQGEASCLTLADFDGDGMIDIAAGSQNVDPGPFGRISILKNDGRGNFPLRWQPPSGVHTVTGIASGYIDGDSNLDFVTAELVDRIVIWHGNGDGTLDYQAPIIRHLPGASDVTIGDFNLDGYNDIAVLGTGQVAIFHNGPAGPSEYTHNYPVGSYSGRITQADLNTDGRLDLLATNFDDGTLSILYGNPDGVFDSAVTLSTGANPYGVAVGDFDNDSKKDISIANGRYFAGEANILMNAPNPVRYFGDFNGDRKTDYAIFRPYGNNPSHWWIQPSSLSPPYAVQLGLGTDKIVPGNYDGDNKTDIAVFRNGTWFILNSSDSTPRQETLGQSGDKSVSADYDNDGKTDLAVFSPAINAWSIVKSSGGTINEMHGQNGDIPVTADYNGDGRADIAVFRPSNGTWFVLNGTTIQFGANGDKPVQGDYDSDGKADFAVFRPSTGTWYILRSSDAQIHSEQFGLSTDIPVPGEYTGDSRNDIAVFRPDNGTWIIKNSEDGSVRFLQWGLNGDIPVPSAYVYW